MSLQLRCDNCDGPISKEKPHPYLIVSRSFGGETFEGLRIVNDLCSWTCARDYCEKKRLIGEDNHIEHVAGVGIA